MSPRAVIATLLSLSLLACPDEAGRETGPCFPNGTCMEGLSCLSNVCVQVPHPDAGASPDAGAPPDAGQTPGPDAGAPKPCANADGSFAPPTTVCRPATGPCDLEETCLGTSADCPEDGFEPAGATCRPSAGACDVAEACTGKGPECPADGFKPAGTPCRAAAGDCDVAESCPGTGAKCPTDALEPVTAVCRASVNECDAPETCGAGPTCPLDVWRVDLSSDPDNCGACKRVCDRCAASTCITDYEWARWRLPPESPASYTANADFVTDNVTGLVWQQVLSLSNYSWGDAKTYCSGLSLAGRDGWRLPTAIELASLVDSGRSNPASNSNAFTDAPAALFWSSTPRAGAPGRAWLVNFYVGDVNHAAVSDTNRVRCVH